MRDVATTILALFVLVPGLCGQDDGPFEKGQRDPVPLVAVMMERADDLTADRASQQEE